MTTVKVTSAAELLDALATANDIEVDGSLTGMPMITAAGVGSDAVCLTGEVAGLDEVSVTAAHGQRMSAGRSRGGQPNPVTSVLRGGVAAT
jgi:hypothetical protein